MKTRFTEQTGIEYACVKGCGWGHFDCNDCALGDAIYGRHVGPWYVTKIELLADHEDYLRRAGWLIEPHQLYSGPCD